MKFGVWVRVGVGVNKGNDKNMVDFCCSNEIIDNIEFFVEIKFNWSSLAIDIFSANLISFSFILILFFFPFKFFFQGIYVICLEFCQLNKNNNITKV